MGKKIRISESQFKFITEGMVMEGQKLDALKQKLESFKKDVENLRVIKDYSKDFFEFLDDVRESGMVNMYQASDLFWSGSDWIRKWADLHAPHLSDNDYDDEDEDDYTEHKEAFQRVLDNADDIRDKLIRTTLSKEGVDYDNADRAVRKMASDILVLWMKHFGTSMGRMKVEVDEIARTLSKGRKHNKSVRFSEPSLRYSPMRFGNLGESFFFADVNNEIICDNCGHTWEVKQEDPHPELCHMCCYDQGKEEFDIDSVIEFWTNKKED